MSAPVKLPSTMSAAVIESSRMSAELRAVSDLVRADGTGPELARADRTAAISAASTASS